MSCQMLEPVKPLTTPTPSFCAARAVFFISSMERRRTPSGLPSPQTRGGRTALVAGVDVVEHALADEVIRDGEQLQVVLFQEVAFAGAIRIVGDRFLDLEVVAPASQLEPVVPEVAGFFAQRFEG